MRFPVISCVTYNGLLRAGDLLDFGPSVAQGGGVPTATHTGWALRAAFAGNDLRDSAVVRRTLTC